MLLAADSNRSADNIRTQTVIRDIDFQIRTGLKHGYVGARIYEKFNPSGYIQAGEINVTVYIRPFVFSVSYFVISRNSQAIR